MVKLAGFAVLACAVIFPVVHAATAGPSAEQAIRPIMAEMGRAAKAHDADTFMAPFLRSPGLVFVINGKIIRGWDALHAQQVKWWRQGKSDVVYTPQGKPAFMQLARDVVVTTLELASHRTLPDGKVGTGTFVVTDVWKKLPQGWRIVYGHESWAKPPG